MLKVIQPHCVLTVTNHSASARCTVCGILNSYFSLKKKGANLSNFWLSPACSIKRLEILFNFFKVFLEFEILLRRKCGNQNQHTVQNSCKRAYTIT